MSLADRIAAAQRDRGVTSAGPSGEGFAGPAARARRTTDPFADLKRAEAVNPATHLDGEAFTGELVDEGHQAELAAEPEPGPEPEPVAAAEPFVLAMALDEQRIIATGG